jgi:hypothetical protein
MDKGVGKRFKRPYRKKRWDWFVTYYIDKVNFSLSNLFILFEALFGPREFFALFVDVTNTNVVGVGFLPAGTLPKTQKFISGLFNTSKTSFLWFIKCLFQLIPLPAQQPLHLPFFHPMKKYSN